MSLDLILIIALSILVVILFACAKAGATDKKEIKRLENELEKYRVVLLNYITESSQIKKDGQEIQKEIENAKTDEELIDILGDIISRNNQRVPNDKTK
jgi:hypothetical protein